MKLAALLLLLIASNSVSAAPKSILSGLLFPEGPVWHNSSLYFVEYSGHTIRKWDGKQNTVFWKKKGCGPSAVTLTTNGHFYVTCYDSMEIVKLSQQGKTLKTFNKDSKGKPFLGPNDFAPDKNGGLYFTASGPWELGPIVGKIYYLDKNDRISVVAEHIHYANGLALTKDGKTLFCAESEAHRVIQFDVKNNVLRNRKLFLEIETVDKKSPHQRPLIKGKYTVSSYRV